MPSAGSCPILGALLRRAVLWVSCMQVMNITQLPHWHWHWPHCLCARWNPSLFSYLVRPGRCPHSSHFLPIDVTRLAIAVAIACSWQKKNVESACGVSHWHCITAAVSMGMSLSEHVLSTAFHMLYTCSDHFLHCTFNLWAGNFNSFLFAAQI